MDILRSAKPLKLLVPQLPRAADLMPWLMRIDENQHYTNFGPLNDELEKELAAVAGAPHAVTVSSGTLGLEVALAAMELPRDGSVLVPSMTFSATVSAISRSGLVPLFGDVDERCLVLTPAIARRVAAAHPIVAVLTPAIHGHVHDPLEWDAFTAETDIPVLIDAAGVAGYQTVGATTSAVFSLHATKPLCAGEGGFIATRSSKLAERMRRLSNFGFDHGTSRWVGTNAKLSEYHAAVGLASLTVWPAQKRRRARLYAEYAKVFDQSRLPPIVRVATSSPATSNLTVMLDRAVDDRRMQDLAELGIETRRWYWPPLHRHAAYAGCPHAGDLAVTERVADRLLGVPFHLGIGREDMHRVCQALSELALSLAA